MFCCSRPQVMLPWLQVTLSLCDCVFLGGESTILHCCCYARAAPSGGVSVVCSSVEC